MTKQVWFRDVIVPWPGDHINLSTSFEKENFFSSLTHPQDPLQNRIESDFDSEEILILPES